MKNMTESTGKSDKKEVQKKTIKKISIIRKSVVFPGLLLITLTATYTVFFLDKHLQIFLQKNLRSLYQATVDVGSITTSIVNGGFHMTRLDFVDKENLAFNKISLKEIDFKFSPKMLLKKKIIIDKITANSIETDTKRSAPGELIKKKEKVTLFLENSKEEVKQRSTDFLNFSLRKKDVSLPKNINLKIENINTKIEELKSVQFEEINNKVKKIEKKVKTLKKEKNALKIIGLTKEIKNEVSNLKKDMKNKTNSIKKTQQSISAGIKDLKKEGASGLKNLKALINIEEISNLLKDYIEIEFKKEIQKQTSFLMPYKEYLPKKKEL